MNLFYEIYMNAHVNVTFPDDPDDVLTIEGDEGVYHVVMPRLGRLGDTRLLNQNGEPENIGPEGAGLWESPHAAAMHFLRIARKFETMNRETT